MKVFIIARTHSAMEREWKKKNGRSGESWTNCVIGKSPWHSHSHLVILTHGQFCKLKVDLDAITTIFIEYRSDELGKHSHAINLQILSFCPSQVTDILRYQILMLNQVLPTDVYGLAAPVTAHTEYVLVIGIYLPSHQETLQKSPVLVLIKQCRELIRIVLSVLTKM